MPKWTKNSASVWRWLKPLGLTLMLSTTLAGCATMMGTRATDTSCKAFVPISWSKKDTDQTIREVKSHNAAYKALCGAQTN